MAGALPATARPGRREVDDRGEGRLVATREAVILGLAFGLPLVFNPFGSLAFEPFKMTVVRLAALAVALTWAAERWIGAPPAGRPAARGPRPLWLAAAAYLAATALASATSIQPLQSLLGGNERHQGLASLLAWLILAAATATRSGVTERPLDWLLAGSGPVCLYALMQQAGLDPLTWLDRTFGPAGTVGTSTALGGFLAMLVPLTVARAAAAARGGRTWRNVGLLVLLGLQLTVIAATGVRGALLGLGAGLAALAVLLLVRGVGRGRSWLVLGLLAAALTATAALNLPGGSVERLRDASPYLERLGGIGLDENSARERLLIWRAAAETWIASDGRLLVGFGPETEALALETRFPLELANRLPDLRFDRVHNELLDHLLTVGMFGLASYCALLLAVGLTGWHLVRTMADPWLPAALLAASAAHLLESAFAFGAAATLLVFWLTIGTLARLATASETPQAEAAEGAPTDGSEPAAGFRSTSPGARAVAIAATAVAVLFLPLVVSPVLADLMYTRALAYRGGKDVVGETAWLRRAELFGPLRDVYPLARGIQLAGRAGQERSARQRAELLTEAESAARRAQALSPREPYNAYHLGQVLEVRAEAERRPEARVEAAEQYERAATLSPNRALFFEAAGLALLRLDRADEALARFRAALDLAGPSAERAARIGDCLLALGSIEEARASYQVGLQLGPRSADVQAGLAALHSRTGDFDQALEHARRAARFQSRDWRYHEEVAALERRVGNLEEAVAAARAAARLGPPWERARLQSLVEDIKRGA